MIAALFAQLPQAAVPAVQDPATSGLEMHGQVALLYRARWSGQDSDQDLGETVDLEFGNRAHDAVTASLSAGARLDLDGVPSGSSTYYSLEDTRGGSFDARLYHAWLDVHCASGWEVLRAGRQTIVETPETAWFDGVRAELAESGSARLRFGAYGGVPVELYSDSRTGDALYGAFAEARPWKGARVRADWMHAEDDLRLGQLSNDLYGIGVWQSLWTSLRVDAEYTRLEEKNRDVRLRANWSASDSDLVLRASWYQLLEPQGALAQAFDPFSSTLYELEPYEQLGLQASKSFGAHLQLQAGYDARRLAHSQDAGTYNHEFDRGWATLGLPGVLPAALELSLTGELWDTQDSSFHTFGAELSRRFDERLDASLGTSYALYKYDLFQARELDHVRSWYARLELDRSGPLRLELRYEFEDEPTGQYHDLRLGATWRF